MCGQTYVIVQEEWFAKVHPVEFISSVIFIEIIQTHQAFFFLIYNFIWQKENLPEFILPQFSEFMD